MFYFLMRQLIVFKHINKFNIMIMITIQQKVFTQLKHTDIKSIIINRIFRSCFVICTIELNINEILFKII